MTTFNETVAELGAPTMIACLLNPRMEGCMSNAVNGSECPSTFTVPEVLEPLYADAELLFCDGPRWTGWSRDNWWIPLVSIALYGILITLGPRIMKNREAFDLKGPLMFWNLGLSIFSWIGASRTVPHLLYNIYTHSFEDTVCEPGLQMFGNGPAGLWTAFFIYSKVPELVDTLFIVLRKRKLIFLHWYHHVTVLLYCWHAFSTEAASGLYFVAMNFSVHAIMYGYYFLAAAKAVPKWFPTHLITLAQISQMFVGVGICVSTSIFSKTRTCHVEPSNQMAGAVMYASYFYLFVEFAVKRFILKPRTKAAKKLA